MPADFSVGGGKLATARLGILLAVVVTYSVLFHLQNCSTFLLTLLFLSSLCLGELREKSLSMLERNWLGRVVFWRSCLSDSGSDQLASDSGGI